MQSTSTQKKITALLKKTLLGLCLCCFITNNINAQFYVNGNLSTGNLVSSGEVAPTGFNWSEVQTGNMTSGYSANIAQSITVADDFTAIEEWNVNKFTCYAYSTGYTGTTSPFTDLRLQIFDTDPSVGNPAPIFGDLNTNRFSVSSSASLYRIFNAMANTNRQVWKIEANISISLNPGTYWVEWQVGTSQASNFSPPSTVAGTITQPGNNAMQHDLANSTWVAILDGPNATDPQDMPFRIDYTCANPTTIITQPVNDTACVGTSATFDATATGSNLTYQWQVSTDGGATFADFPAATSSTFITPPATMNMNYWMVQVVITGCGYPVVSNTAILWVYDGALITTQPLNASVCSGDDQTFSAAATGYNVNYQWQVSPLGCTGPFTNLVAGTAPTYTVYNVNAAQDGYAYRCEIISSCNSSPVFTDCAILTVGGAVSINTQPVNQDVCNGSNALFAVAANSSAATYQWQQSTTGCSGTFTDMPGEISANLTLTGVSPAQNNNAYRCVVSSSCAAAVTSDCAILTIESIDITTQPVDQRVCELSTVVFNVATSATGVSYQWQVSTDNGNTFTDVPWATSSDLTIPDVTASYYGNKYRVLLTNSICTDPVISDVATLYAYHNIYINPQPFNASVCENVQADFFVGVNPSYPDPTATYQWQYSTDNGNNFSNITGATGPDLFVTATQATNGYQYHATVTGIYCPSTIVSNNAILTIDVPPVATITANPTNTALLDGQSVVLTATANPPGANTWSWQEDGIDMGENGNSITIDYGDGETGHSYTVTAYTVPGNCSSVSNAIVVRDSADGGRFMIAANPNNGIFNVICPHIPAQSSLEIFDGHGQRVYFKNNLPANQSIPVDIHSAVSGVYIVVVNNGAAERLATGRVVIIH